MKRLLATLIAAGALAELAAQAVIVSRVPSEAEWKAAATYVRGAFAQGDGVVFAPHWADPIGRVLLGDLVPVEEAARPDRSRQGRIWELSIRGAEHPEAKGRVAETRVFGAVRVRRIERRAAKVLYDFSAEAPDRVRVAEVDFLPYAGIHAAPGDQLEFPDVPMGAVLALGGGIHDFQSRYANDAPVTLRVLVDGRPAAAERFDNRGWRRVEIDTRPLAGRRATVRFRVEAERPKARTFCFHAEVHR
jgi:hypothetical protein